MNDARHHRALALAALYGALVVYGSLFPLTGWQTPDASLLSWIRPLQDGRIIFTDLVLNILVYMPLGLLLVAGLAPKLRPLSALLIAVIAGTALSFTMETLQQFLPGRVSSVHDLGTNMVGTLLGGLMAAILSPQNPVGRWLWQWRHDRFRPDTLGNLMLLALALWALSQLSPLAPSLDIGNLRQGLAPISRVLLDGEALDLRQMSSYFTTVTALGLLTLLAARPRTPVSGLFLVFVLVVLLLKIPVVSRQISLEALTGFALATIAILSLSRLHWRLMAAVAALFFIVTFLIATLPAGPDPAAPLRNFNWMPFKGYVANIRGLAGILENLVPFFALALVLRVLATDRWRTAALWWGGALVAVAVLGFEWRQQFQPGRYPDITDVLLAVAAWTLAWAPRNRLPQDAYDPERQVESSRANRLRLGGF
jgi:VanZ family protein